MPASAARRALIQLVELARAAEDKVDAGRRIVQLVQNADAEHGSTLCHCVVVHSLLFRMVALSRLQREQQQFV